MTPMDIIAYAVLVLALLIMLACLIIALMLAAKIRRMLKDD